MTAISDNVGAFCPHGRFEIAGSPAGPLRGLTFGVKDFIDIAGHVTGAGNPRWLATHAPAAQTAPCVRRLLDAGATMVGKTISDELAYSLNGDNVHYGTPVNVNAPGRVPGGSSSGSASAVAAELCDVALGTDSGGSVRIPASYCGVFGIRATHGRIATEGVVPFMPSLDAVGWFARDVDVFAAVGDVLLQGTGGEAPLRRLLVATDAFAIADSDTADALAAGIERLGGLLGRREPVRVAEDDDLDAWRQVFRIVSAAEAWATFGAWIEEAQPELGPAIAERFAFAKSVDADALRAAALRRDCIRARACDLLGRDGVICIPTAPGPAPLVRADGAAVEAFRQRAQRLTCIAGLAGLPQVSIPGGRVDGALPVGLSLIGPPGSDRALLALCGRLADS
jgi:amidase